MKRQIRKMLILLLIIIFCLIIGSSYALASTSKSTQTTSAASVTISLNTPSLTVSSEKIGIINVTIGTVKGADGYKLYLTEEENGKYSAIKTIKEGSKTSFQLKNYKEGKAYYLKLRAYRKVSGETYWSKYCEPQRVVVLSGYMAEVRRAQDKLADQLDLMVGLSRDTITEMQYAMNNRMEIMIRLIRGDTFEHIGKNTGVKYEYRPLLWQYPNREGFEPQIDGVHITVNELMQAGITEEDFRELLRVDDNFSISTRFPYVYGISIEYKNPVRNILNALWSPSSIMKYSHCLFIEDVLDKYNELLVKVNDTKVLPTEKTLNSLDNVKTFITDHFGTEEYYELLFRLALCNEITQYVVLSMCPSLAGGPDFSGSDLVMAKKYLAEEELLYQEFQQLSSEVELIPRDDSKAIKQYTKKVDQLLLKLHMLYSKANRLDYKSHPSWNVYQSDLPGADFTVFIEQGPMNNNDTPVLGFEVTNNEKEEMIINSKDCYLFPPVDIIEDPYDGMKATLVTEDGSKVESVRIAPGESEWIWFYFDGQLVDTLLIKDNYSFFSIVSFHVIVGKQDFFYTIDDTDICNYTDYYEEFLAKRSEAGLVN